MASTDLIIAYRRAPMRRPSLDFPTTGNRPARETMRLIRSLPTAALPFGRPKCGGTVDRHRWFLQAPVAPRRWFLLYGDRRRFHIVHATLTDAVLPLAPSPGPPRRGCQRDRATPVRSHISCRDGPAWRSPAPYPPAGGWPPTGWAGRVPAAKSPDGWRIAHAHNGNINKQAAARDPAKSPAQE